MILRYRPDDGPPVEFEFLPGELETPESEAVEAVGGDSWGTFEEWGALFFRGSQKARRAALWVFLRRQNPRLKFSDLTFRTEQVDVDYSAIERARIIEVMLANPDLDEEQRRFFTQMIADTDAVAEVEETLTRSGVEVPRDDPKDHPSFFGDGGSTSPPPV
jgi:hypothetical protein